MFRWLARALSLGSVGFVLLFAVADLPSLSALTPRELLLFALFPVGMCLGLIIAWWRERFGGGFAVLCVAAFYLVHYLSVHRLPKGPWLLVLPLPGLLFLFCAPRGRSGDAP